MNGGRETIGGGGRRRIPWAAVPIGAGKLGGSPVGGGCVYGSVHGKVV